MALRTTWRCKVAKFRPNCPGVKVISNVESRCHANFRGQPVQRTFIIRPHVDCVGLQHPFPKPNFGKNPVTPHRCQSSRRPAPHRPTKTQPNNGYWTRHGFTRLDSGHYKNTSQPSAWQQHGPKSAGKKFVTTWAWVGSTEWH